MKKFLLGPLLLLGLASHAQAADCDGAAISGMVVGGVAGACYYAKVNSDGSLPVTTTPSATPGNVILNAAATAAAGVAPVQSSAVETGHVIKASAGNLYAFNVSADATLSAVAWAVMIFNSTTVPAAGAVTPVKCYLAPIGTTSISGSFSLPLYLSTGVSIAVSTGQTCFTKTDSAHGFISANVQ